MKLFKIILNVLRQIVMFAGLVSIMIVLTAWSGSWIGSVSLIISFTLLPLLYDLLDYAKVCREYQAIKKKKDGDK